MCLKDDISHKPNNCNKPVGRFSSAYCTQNSRLHLALIFPHFLPHFTFLILEFLKNIGHTGIAGTKKWLDQAVFPCWSNYHTLAGE